MMATTHPGVFEPKIVGFLCQWCGYAGADLAGISRHKYPHNLRVVRVLCSGRVDPVFVVGSFLKGADGVMVVGCHPGDCHYNTGNREAVNMAVAARLLIGRAGLDSNRFLLDWVSASEGLKFARLVSDFTASLKTAGPLWSGLPDDDNKLKSLLGAALAVAQGEKMRYLMGMVTPFTTEGNRYGERFTRNEMQRALESTILDEFSAKLILQKLENRDMSAHQLAEELREAPSRVIALLVNLERRGAVRRLSFAAGSPVFGIAGAVEASGAC